jgi:hypothetical protein
MTTQQTVLDPMAEEAYLNTADELSADPTFLEDMDPWWKEQAEAFAARWSLPFPPVADIDQAQVEVQAAYEREGFGCSHAVLSDCPHYS